VSLTLSAIAALCACVVIIYRFYDRAETPESIDKWIAKLEADGGNAASKIAGEEARKAFVRIDKNYRVNAIRYGWLIIGFLAALGSLLIDVATLIIFTVTKLHQ
jgi:small-conductance mechanosensitive channel